MYSSTLTTNYAYAYWDVRLSNTQMGITLHSPYYLMVIRRGNFIEIGYSYGDPIFRLSKHSTEILCDIDAVKNYEYETVFVNVKRAPSIKRWGKLVSARTFGGTWVEKIGSGKLTINYFSKDNCKFNFTNLPLERHYCKVSAKKDREIVKYVIDMLKSYSMILANEQSPFPIDDSTRESMGNTLPYGIDNITGKHLYEAYIVLNQDKDRLYRYLLDYYRRNLPWLISRLEAISRNMEAFYRASGTVKYLPLENETFGVSNG